MSLVPLVNYRQMGKAATSPSFTSRLDQEKVPL